MSFVIDDKPPISSLANKSAGAYVRRDSSTDRKRGIPTISKFETPARPKAPILSFLGASSLLESYTGVIEAVEGGHVFLTLFSDGQDYEAEFSDSVFEPGVPIKVGRGVEAKKIRRRDDLVGWTVRVLPPEPVDFEELERYSQALAQKFDGSGL